MHIQVQGFELLPGLGAENDLEHKIYKYAPIFKSTRSKIDVLSGHNTGFESYYRLCENLNILLQIDNFAQIQEYSPN